MVVFAHTPPPHHGQSQMVKLLIDGMAGDQPEGVARQADSGAGGAQEKNGALGIECYHVNARLSRDLRDIGSARWQKIFLLIGYCAQALWLRVRYAATALYFVPAAPLRASLYRDWVVMLLCRGAFRSTICHWQAVGMGEWLETHAQGWEKRISHALMDKVELAIVLSKFTQADAERFHPRNVGLVPNGIPDPCPDYDTTARPRRACRSSLRRRLLVGERVEQPLPRWAGENPAEVKVLFMAHCSRDKGCSTRLKGFAYSWASSRE
ncbi:Glycosyl transferase group 1 (fragment) [Verrucomicrobia bacterium]